MLENIKYPLKMSEMNTHQNEIILYQPDNAVQIEVMLENETVWLPLDKMAELFQKNKSTVSRHIKNVFEEKELDKTSTVANFATVQTEGNRQVERYIEYFNLDVIISVGYRVKSQRGIQFRQWANSVLKEYILKGYSISQRFERLEYRVAKAEKKIDFFVKTALPPVQGIFYDGQIFDAYVFVSDLIKSAKKSIVLLDNYIDESVLLLLSKRLPKISAKIYTKNIHQQLQLDLTRHNSQYEAVSIYESDIFHDRFLIIDDTVYYIGASLKDLGKKLFAFSKMEVKATDILRNVL